MSLEIVVLDRLKKNHALMSAFGPEKPRASPLWQICYVLTALTRARAFPWSTFKFVLITAWGIPCFFVFFYKAPAFWMSVLALGKKKHGPWVCAFNSNLDGYTKCVTPRWQRKEGRLPVRAPLHHSWDIQYMTPSQPEYTKRPPRTGGSSYFLIEFTWDSILLIKTFNKK